MRKLLALLFLLLASPAFSDTIANPTLWHIKSGKGEVYLLGSVHILPPDVNWRSASIMAAASRADIYVFEAPVDDASMAQYRDAVLSNGYLPASNTLRGLLHPQSLADFDAAVAASGIDSQLVEHERPWLAGLHLMLAASSKLNFDPKIGVDVTLMAQAASAGKQARYLETTAQQLAVILPSDPALELAEFESGLKDLRDLAGELRPLIAAWGAGDQKKLDALLNGDMDEFPAARKALLDDRNARWLPQIRAMLKERHVFLVTVGAGHLTGPKGVPALLRAAGYRVEGP